MVLWAAHYALQEVMPSSEQRSNVVEGLFAYDDKLVKTLEKLGKRHLPASLTKVRRAIAAEAKAYHDARDRLVAGAARHRHLQAGYLADELDERGWPKPEAHQALVKRQRIADRDKALANGVPEDEIAIDADGRFKPGCEPTGAGDPLRYAEDAMDDEDEYYHEGPDADDVAVDDLAAELLDDDGGEAA